MERPSYHRYLANLSFNQQSLQVAMDDLLAKYSVLPIGFGYGDLIIDCEGAINILGELARLPIALDYFSWWCLCTTESKMTLGCPHGMGGPMNVFGEGQFCESNHLPDFDARSGLNQLCSLTEDPFQFAAAITDYTVNYLKNVFPNEPFFSPCLHLGLWLYVPLEWNRKLYMPEV